MAAAFQYKYQGDTPKLFRGRLINAGDLVDSDEELINGELAPANPAAKKAVADRAALEAAPPASPAPPTPTNPASAPAAAKE